MVQVSRIAAGHDQRPLKEFHHSFGKTIFIYEGCLLQVPHDLAATQPQVLPRRHAMAAPFVLFQTMGLFFPECIAKKASQVTKKLRQQLFSLQAAVANGASSAPQEASKEDLRQVGDEGPLRREGEPSRPVGPKRSR